MDEVGSDVVGIRLSPFTEFYGANETGKLGCIIVYVLLQQNLQTCSTCQTEKARSQEACLQLPVLLLFTAAFDAGHAIVLMLVLLLSTCFA